MSELGGNSREQLKSIIERVEKLEEEKAAVASDISDVYKEAKGNGFDPKVLRAIVHRRKQDEAELREFEDTIDTYMVALGMAPAA
jgi:uncharacterized protein (UPF0335 family)